MASLGKILLVGGGGHCKSVLDSLLDNNEYDKIAIIDKNADNQKEIMGIEIIGNDNDLPNLYRQGYHNAFITVGSVGDTSARIRLYEHLLDIGFHIPNIIDKVSIIARGVILGAGIYIGKRAVVNAEAHIGDCAILNTGCIVEHNCEVGSFTHVSAGAVLCGGVKAGSSTHIGAMASVRHGIVIGNHVMVGLGSVVVKNIADYKTVYGNPAAEVANE